MLKKIGLTFLAMVLAVFGYAALKPAEYVISREIVVHAPPEKIFPHLNSSRLANDWMPWNQADPQAKIFFTGPPEGVGSRSSWDSPGKLGTGTATIVESVPNESVRVQLEYQKPFQMTQE